MKIKSLVVDKSRTVPQKNGGYEKTRYVLECEICEADNLETVRQALEIRINRWLDENGKEA